MLTYRGLLDSSVSSDFVVTCYTRRISCFLDQDSTDAQLCPNSITSVLLNTCLKPGFRPGLRHVLSRSQTCRRQVRDQKKSRTCFTPDRSILTYSDALVLAHNSRRGGSVTSASRDITTTHKATDQMPRAGHWPRRPKASVDILHRLKTSCAIRNIKADPLIGFDADFGEKSG